MWEPAQHNPMFLSHPVDGQLLDVSLLGELRSLCTLVEKNSKGVFLVYLFHDFL